MAAALVAAPAMAAEQANGTGGALRLRLTCAGSIDQTSTKNGFFGPTKDHQQIPAQIDVDIADDAGRARLPARLLPMFGKPSDGWSDIKNFRISADSIDGSVDIRSMSHPKLHIDRQSGSISLEGILGKFFGTCLALDVAKRAF